MKRLAIALVLAALAALVAWAAWSGADSALEPPDGLLDERATERPEAAQSVAADAWATDDDDALLLQRIETEPIAQSGLATLVVRVRRDDGRPVPHVTVVAAPPLVADARLDEANVVTDERGQATFALAPGRYELRTSLGAAKTVALQEGFAETIELTLPSAPAVLGVVVDEREQPIADAEVLVLGLTAVGTARVSARTAADGSFELPGIGAGRRIAARHEAFAPSVPQRVELADARFPTVTIRMSKGSGRIAGSVATTDGAALPGAIVWFGPATPGAFPAQVVRSDDTGFFRSPPLPSGPVEVRAIARGRSLLTTRAEAPRDGEANLRLLLPAGGVVRGIAKLSDGSPAAQCVVWSGVRRAIGSRLARTGPDGSFALDRLPEGEVELTALALAADGVSLQRAVERVPVTSGAAAAWNPTLAPVARGAVRGALRLDDGSPLSGWLVLATPRGQSRGLGVETREDGTFTLLGLPAGEVTVAVRRPDAGWQSFDDARRDGVVVDGEPVQIVVPSSALDRASLLGSVRDEDSRPRAATLRVLHGSGVTAQYATRLDGTFRIDGIPQGEARLEIRCEGMPPLSLQPFVLRGRETRDLGVLVVRSGGVAFGRLLGEGDAPPTNPSVRLLGDGDRDLGEVAVDAAGYRTPMLEAGRYELLVRADSVAPARVPIEIPRGGDRELDIRMLPGSLHRIRVTTRDPRDVAAKVSVVVFDRAGKAIWAANLPTTQGEAEFRAWLADGDYQVLALGMRQQRARGTFAVEAAASAEPGLTALELGN